MRRLIVGISGASGAIYGVRALQGFRHASDIETPLMLSATAARSGAIIAPPVPAFYNRPTTIDDIVDHSVGKALDLFGIGHQLFRRWKEAVADDALRSVRDP